MPAPLAILDVGGTEILLILLVTLLLFGSERLPSLARGLGKSIREFKKATAGLEEEWRRAMETPPPPAAPQPLAPAQTSVPPDLAEAVAEPAPPLAPPPEAAPAAPPPASPEAHEDDPPRG